MVYFITRAIVNCLKYYISKEECYCENGTLMYKRILFKKIYTKRNGNPIIEYSKGYR